MSITEIRGCNKHWPNLVVIGPGIVVCPLCMALERIEIGHETRDALDAQVADLKQEIEDLEAQQAEAQEERESNGD